MPNNKSTAQEPKSNRRKLYKLHAWVGFHLAFLMMVVLTTGTLATVSNEIDWLFNKELRVTPAKERVSWQTMTDAVEAYAPNSTIINIQALEGDYLAHRATTIDQNEKRSYIYVDQWTGHVTGETGLLTVQRFLRDMHRYLFMPKVLGLPIISSMAFILLISLYTGLKTSRNWKTLMTRVRINKGTRVMIGDAHKAAGLWSIWLIVLMAITGIWYLAELGSEITAFVKKDSSYTFVMSRPALTDERLKTIGNVITTPSVSDITNAATQAFPEIKGRITNIYFPSASDQPITVLGVRDNPLLRERANRIFLDPQSLEVLEVQRSENITWVAWLNEMADPLHFGFFGGLITKLIWFIFGLAMTSLSVSGVYLTWKRLKSKSVSRTQIATLPVFLLACVFGYFWFQNYVTPEKPHYEHVLNYQSDNGIDLKLFLELNKKEQLSGKLRLLISSKEGTVNVNNITATLQQEYQKLKNEKKLRRRVHAQTALYTTSFSSTNFMLPGQLVIKVNLNNGENIIASWPLGNLTNTKQ